MLEETKFRIFVSDKNLNSVDAVVRKCAKVQWLRVPRVRSRSPIL